MDSCENASLQRTAGRGAVHRRGAEILTTPSTHTHTHRLCYSFILSLSAGLFLFLGLLHMSVFQNVPSWWFCWPSFCTVWRLGTVGTKQGGTKWLLTLVKYFCGGELVQQSCWLQHRRPQSVFYILRSKHLVFTLFCRTLRDFLSHCKTHIPPKDPIICFISAGKHISQSRLCSQLRFRSLDLVSVTKKRWGDSNINPHRPRQLIKYLLITINLCFAPLILSTCFKNLMLFGHSGTL